MAWIAGRLAAWPDDDDTHSRALARQYLRAPSRRVILRGPGGRATDPLGADPAPEFIDQHDEH